MNEDQTHDLTSILDQHVERYMKLDADGSAPSIEEFVREHADGDPRLIEILKTAVFVHRLEQGDSSETQNFPEIRDYRLLKVTGRGGMGIVYEAQQISLGRPVALKVIPRSMSDTKQSIQRFELEARTAAQLQHENIVPVYEVGAAQEFHWYSMRLIDGKSLHAVIQAARVLLQNRACQRSEVLSELASSGLVSFAEKNEEAQESPTEADANRRGRDKRQTGVSTSKISADSTTRLDPRRTYFQNVARIGRDVADALQYAHENRVLHRDIKPANLLLDRSGKVWVTDFGLAKTEDQDLTQTGDVVGTLRFLSPERLDGTSHQSSDVYSLGATLYEMLALQPAFEAVSQYRVIEKIRNHTPPRLSSIDSTIPRDLVTIVEKAMEKEPDRRYASAQLMAEDLGLFLAGRPIRARRVSKIEQLISWSKRNPGIATAVAGIFLLVMTGLIGASIAAIQFRDMAIEQRRLTKLAKKESNDNQQNLYYAEMKLGVEAAESPSGRTALQSILGHWIPEDSTQPDRRGFEWYWMHSMFHPNSIQLIEQGWDGLQFNADGDLLCRFGHDAIEIASWPEFEELWSWYPDDRPLLVNAKMDLAGQRLAFLFNRNNKQMGSPNEPVTRSLRVVDWKKNEALFELNEVGPVAVAWKPDGSQLAVLIPTKLPEIDNCSLRIYETQDWRVAIEFEVPHKISRFDTNLKYSHDGKRLAVNIENSTPHEKRSELEKGNYGILCFETANWKLGNSWIQSESPINNFDWHPTRSSVAMASHSDVICWDVAEGTIITDDLEEFKQTLSWDRKGENIVVAGSGHVQMLDEKLRPKRHWLIDDVHNIFAQPHTKSDEIVVAVGKANHSRTLRLSQQHHPVQSIFGPAIKHIDHSPWYGHLHWSPDGKRLMSSLDQGTTLWDVATGDPLYIDNRFDCSFVGAGAGWISNENCLAILAMDGFVFSGMPHEKSQQPVPPKRIFRIKRSGSLDSTGSNLYTPGDLDTRSNWGLSKIEINTEQVTEILPIQEGGISCRGKPDPDDRYFALAVSPHDSNPKHRLVIVDLKSKSILYEFGVDQEVRRIAWSKDGGRLAYADSNHVITIRETDTFEIVDKYLGHSGEISGLDWSPDGQRLASASLDQTVRLWDTSTGKQVVALKQDSGVNAVAWSPEGRRLATINLHGYTMIYDATTGYHAAEIESKD